MNWFSSLALILGGVSRKEHLDNSVAFGTWTEFLMGNMCHLYIRFPHDHRIYLNIPFPLVKFSVFQFLYHSVQPYEKPFENDTNLKTSRVFLAQTDLGEFKHEMLV